MTPSAWTHRNRRFTIAGRESALEGGLAFPQAPVIARLDVIKARGASVQRRIYPSSRPFGLFAAEGVDQDRQAR